MVVVLQMEGVVEVPPLVEEEEEQDLLVVGEEEVPQMDLI